MKTLQIYKFEGADGMTKMQDVMKMFRFGFRSIGGLKVEEIKGHDKCPDGADGTGLNDPEYRLAGGSCVILKPSGIEPEIEVTVYIPDDTDNAAETEARIRRDLESIIYMDHGMGYCCE